MQLWNGSSCTPEESIFFGILSSSPTLSLVDKSATFPFLQSTRWKKTVNFFPEYACSFEKSDFCFLLRAVFAIYHFSKAVLTRHQQLPDVGLHNHSAAVFPVKQVCRICLRCCQGGCSVTIWTALSTGQAANSLWLSPLSGLCCWLHIITVMKVFLLITAFQKASSIWNNYQSIVFRVRLAVLLFEICFKYPNSCRIFSWP